MRKRQEERQLIPLLQADGMCITYDRILEINSQLGKTVVDQYVEGVVSFPILMKYLFTHAAVYNIDHTLLPLELVNPSMARVFLFHKKTSAENSGVNQEPTQPQIGSQVKTALSFQNHSPM